MKQGLRWIAALLVALLLISLASAQVLGTLTHTWVEKDLALRAQLAARGASRGLHADFAQGQLDGLQRQLDQLIRDERILAAQLCAFPARPIAGTSGFPADWACPAVNQRAQALLQAQSQWHALVSLGADRVHLSATPLHSEDGAGQVYLVLVQDFGFAEARARRAAAVLLLAFAALALLVSAAPLLMLHAARQRWRLFRQRRLQRRKREGVLAPGLCDVPASESDAHLPWTQERLRATLRRALRGERLVVLANREPYVHERDAEGNVHVLHPASGLVSALEPVLRACSGVWVAHGAGSADRQTADLHGRLPVPPGDPAYTLRRVWLTPEQERGYYQGFANEGLWPLCHVAHERPVFRSEDWRHYREVNQKFADAVCQEVDRDDPVILVQDYHFALAPRMLRQRLPNATIVSFWHIPWPNPEQLAICPWHMELMDGLLGSSIIGFHTQGHCNNFLAAADRFLESCVDREQFAVVRQGQRAFVRPYPISVEWPHRWAQAAPSIAECRAAVRAEFKLAPDIALGIGIDRLDYTKGIAERLRAVERLFERHPRWRGRFSFVQLSSPSRTDIERYRRLHAEVEELVQRINARFATPQWSPIVFRRQHTEPADVFRYYRAADLCYVSSLHDGMNLVAKEFIAARDDERGVLLLSSFAGAACELTEALLVNPYDIDASSEALATALLMPAAEQQGRMQAMRRTVAEANVYRWAGHMLLEASRLRQRQQLNTGFKLPLVTPPKERAA